MVLSSLSEPAKGRIARVDIGGLPVGGQTALAFHRFEGEVPFLPRMALEVWDTAPEDWPQPLADIYGAVWHDPVAWAEKAVTLGAEMLVLRLMGGGAKGDAKATAETAGVAAAVVEATGIPAVILGPGEPERDAEVGKAVAAALSGKHCFLGMAEEVNHRALGAAALGYGQGVIASSPIDVNLAKQLNVLLSRLGLEESAIIDGASNIRVLFAIYVPLSKAAIATITLFFAVGKWNAYFNAVMYTTSPAKMPVQLYLRNILLNLDTLLESDPQQLEYVATEGVRAATVVAAMLPILMVYPFAQRYFIHGMMIGAIKE